MYFHALPVSGTKDTPRTTTIPPRAAAREGARKLLVAFDGSPAARGALDYAAGRAKAEGSSLHVVNVQEVLVDDEAILHAFRKFGVRILEDAAELLAPHLIRFTSEIAFGSTARAIVRTARRAGADHIVMGTRKRSGIASLLLPGVAPQVLRLADRPVTVIKEGTT